MLYNIKKVFIPSENDAKRFLKLMRSNEEK